MAEYIRVVNNTANGINVAVSITPADQAALATVSAAFFPIPPGSISSWRRVAPRIVSVVRADPIVNGQVETFVAVPGNVALPPGQDAGPVLVINSAAVD